MEQQQKKSKLIYWILGVVLVLILVGAIFYLKQSNNQPQSNSDDQSTEKLKKLSFDKKGTTSDPFNDPRGPYYHKIFSASSSDGVTFTRGEEVVDHASVPDIVKTLDGTLFFYAVDGSSRSISGVMVGRSKDNGKTWEIGSMRLKNNSNGTGGADPEAILLDDDKIRLFYVVMPLNKPPLDNSGTPISNGEGNKVMSATSTDGINFTEESGVRFTSEKFVTDPDIVKIGSTWFMYLAEGPKQTYTTSTDGLTFTYQGVIRDQGSVSKTVPLGSGQYRQFFCKNGISSATTTDGIKFSNELTSLAAKNDEIICDPTPVQIGTNWLMLFKSQTGSSAGNNNPPPLANPASPTN